MCIAGNLLSVVIPRPRGGEDVPGVGKVCNYSTVSNVTPADHVCLFDTTRFFIIVSIDFESFSILTFSSFFSFPSIFYCNTLLLLLICYRTFQVFVEYSDTAGAAKAKSSLHGRRFGGNSVVAVYYSEEKFANEDFGG